HQYSIPVFPFLLITVISTIANRQETSKHFWPNLRNHLWNHRHWGPQIWQRVSQRISLQSVKQIWMKRLWIRRIWQWVKLLFANLSKLLILWSLLMFLILAKYGYFWTVYLEHLDTWQATRQAINLVETQGNVLTDNYLAPHLAHRKTIKLLHQVANGQSLQEFEYVLLNLRHPWHDTADIGDRVAVQLKKSALFELKYQQDDVFLFRKLVD
ncbi:MAG: DUF2079 domain-containing protein, partial [Microcoleus sp.]